MFENSFNYNITKSTVSQLEKWGKTTRIFDESLTGFGNISHAHISESIIETKIKVKDKGEIKPVYTYRRDVQNEYGEGYPYLELNKLAIIREYDGVYVLVTFDDVDDLANWVTIITK